MSDVLCAMEATDQRYIDISNWVQVELDRIRALKAGIQSGIPSLNHAEEYLEDAYRVLVHLFRNSTNEVSRAGYLDEAQRMLTLAVAERERFERLCQR